MPIRIRRVYEEPARDDGFRVLVDRVWPRGLSKKDAAIDLWLREAAPSTELRKWFGHEESKWPEFRKRYLAELRCRPQALKPLLARARGARITLVYGARDERFNNAVALKAYLERELLG